jgi:hypothetical protein
MVSVRNASGVLNNGLQECLPQRCRLLLVLRCAPVDLVPVKSSIGVLVPAETRTSR